MSEIEKLRALLAEARGVCEYPEFVPSSENRKHARSLRARIDAALAEPVDDYDVDADLRLHKEDRLRLRAENLRLERERDEARAEVERLRGLKPIGTYSLDWNHEQERQNTARAAYQRGAEAMREAAALCAEREETQLPLHVASAIRALPIPEDK